MVTGLMIHKYGFQITDYPVIHMPKGAKILRFGSQRENPVIWALVDPSEPMRERRFRLAGTGHEIEERFDELKYIGTEMFMQDSLVFHLFEIV